MSQPSWAVGAPWREVPTWGAISLQEPKALGSNAHDPHLSWVPLAVHGSDVKGRELSVALVSWDLTLPPTSQGGTLHSPCDLEPSPWKWDGMSGLHPSYWAGNGPGPGWVGTAKDSFALTGSPHLWGLCFSLQAQLPSAVARSLFLVTLASTSLSQTLDFHFHDFFIWSFYNLTSGTTSMTWSYTSLFHHQKLHHFENFYSSATVFQSHQIDPTISNPLIPLRFYPSSDHHFSICLCGRQNNAPPPKKSTSSSLESCEYVRLHGKKELRMQMELVLLILEETPPVDPLHSNQSDFLKL